MARIGIKYASGSFGVGLGWGAGGVGIITFMSTWKYVILRCGIFSCTCTHTSCYAVGSSLALAHIRHATLWDLQLCQCYIVTFVQTDKYLFNVKSRLLVLRSLKKPVPRVQLIDVSFHDSAKISWMSKTLGKPWKNNIQMPAEHSTQLSIRNPKWRRHRNHCGFLCACSLKTSPNRINHNLTILSPWAEPERFWSCWDSQRSLVD